MSGRLADDLDGLGHAAGGERHRNAQHLAEAQVDVRDLRRGEARQGRGDLVTAGGESDETVRAGRVGDHLAGPAAGGLRRDGRSDERAALRVADDAFDGGPLLLRGERHRDREHRQQRHE